MSKGNTLKIIDFSNLIDQPVKNSVHPLAASVSVSWDCKVICIMSPSGRTGRIVQL